MPQGQYEETKATARLPSLDIEIIHSRSPSGDAERISISVLAVPTFEAFGRYLEAANPFLFWMRLARTAWTPWLGATPAKHSKRNLGRLPPAEKTDLPIPTSQHEGDG